MALWEQRERTRTEILSAVDDAERSLTQGLALTLDESSVQALVERVKQRGRARLIDSQQVR